jgi:hypothetical protein
MGTRAPACSILQVELLVNGVCTWGGLLSVTLCCTCCCPAAYVDLLSIPTTSLRLAAGVVPSLALFATLEGLLRQCSDSDLPALLTTLLAAVRALLEPEGGGSCGCSQQPTRGLASSTHDTMATTGSSSCPASDTIPAANTSDPASPSSSSPPPNTAVVLAPGVLEALSSTAVTVSKVLMKEATRTAETSEGVSPPAASDLDQYGNILLLGARLCDVLLQLALQQHQRQQSQQQQMISRALLQLVQGAECLLEQAGKGAMLWVMWQTRRATLYTMMEGRVSAMGGPTQPSSTSALTQHHLGSLLLPHLCTGQARLAAVQGAAGSAAAHQQAATAAAAAHGTSTGRAASPVPVAVLAGAQPTAVAQHPLPCAMLVRCP